MTNIQKLATKCSTFLVLFAAYLFSSVARAETHDHQHVRHNMVLFGEQEVFASHIVYKDPHNVQVILQLSLPSDTKSQYSLERALHPLDTFIFLLDPSNIKEISTQASISGDFRREDAEGQTTIFIPHLELASADYKIVFFDIVPLSLEANQPTH